jgi:hypothetical protein
VSNPKLFELQSHQTVLKARCLVGVVAVVGSLVEGLDSLDAAVNVGGSIAGVGSNSGRVGKKGNRWLSLTLVDLADGGDREWGGNALVRSGTGSPGIGVGGVGVSKGRLSLTLVDLADGGNREGGGNALVGRSTGSPDVSVGGIGVSKGRLSLTLVDLAHSGDGEGGGNALVGSGTGSPGVSVSIGSIGVSKGWLSLSLTLAKVVSVSVATIGSRQVSISVTSVVGTISIGGNSVGSVEEGWIGVSSSDGSAGSEGNNGEKLHFAKVELIAIE